MESSLFFLVAVIAGGLFLLWMILYFIPIGLWFQALVSDVKISLLQLVLMRWRKVPPTVIVRAMIEGKKAGLELYRDLLEAHYLAGSRCGRIRRGCQVRRTGWPGKGERTDRNPAWQKTGIRR